MAEVRIWKADFEAGRLPWVCVKTGEPPIRLVRFTFISSKAPAILGILLPAIIWLPLLLLTAGTARGVLPMTERASRQAFAARWFPIVGLLGSLALFLWGASVTGFGLGAAEGIGLLVAFAGLALFCLTLLINPVIRRSRSVSGRVVWDVRDSYVVISGVHPTFAAQVIGMYAGERIQLSSDLMPAAGMPR